MEEASVGRGWRLHLHLDIRLILVVVTGHLVELKLVVVTLGVDQGLVKVENEEFAEALLFELELNFIIFYDLREFFYLLDNINRLDHLHRHVLVHRYLQRGVWKVFVILKQFIRVQRGSVLRRLLRVRRRFFFGRADVVAQLALRILLAFS